MRPSIFRRTFFIKKELQGKYIFRYFLLFGFGIILFTLIFSFFSSNTLSIVYDNYHLQPGTTPGILMNKILGTQWILIVVGGGLVMLFTLLITHRIAGPFFRFEATLDEMNAKNLTYTIFLRKKDEGKELAIKINQFNAGMAKDLAALRSNLEEIRSMVDQELQKTAKGEDSAAGHELKRIRELNADSLNLIGQYRIDKD